MLSIFAAALLAATPSPTAQTPAGPTSPEQGDVACAALFLALVDEAKTDKDRAGLSAAALYFIGKIEGRRPDVDMATTIADYGKRAGLLQLKSEGKRCAAAFDVMGRQLTRLADLLDAK